MRKGLITDLLLSGVMAAFVGLVYTECTRVENLIIFNLFFLTFRVFGLEDFMTNNEIADMIAEANENRKKTSENWTKEKYDTTNEIVDKIRRGEME